MKLELEVLNGSRKGQRLSLKNGLQIGRKSEPMHWDDPEMSDVHGVFLVDHKKQWNFECLDGSVVRVGSSEVPRASLLLGLVFHIGQTGFKVVERPPLLYENWQEGVKDWLNTHSGRELYSPITFFSYMVQLAFVEGMQFGQFYTLSYGPREIGHNSLDLNIADPSAPPRVAQLFQENNDIWIENLCGPVALINGFPFEKQLVKNGDRLSITTNVIELSILK